MNKVQKRILETLIPVLISLGLFLFILLDRSPSPVRPVALQVRFGFTIVLPIVFMLLLMVLRIKGIVGQATTLSTVMALFALSLAGLWASGYTDSVTVSGLLPWSDADGFYDDARRLLEGWDLTHISARRPLFSGFLAVLLALSRQNLQAALAVLVLINAVTCYLAIREISKTHGAMAAALTFTLLFFFYRRFSGSVMTENLGLALGTLGLAMLWHGAVKKPGGFIPLGILLITLGLNARAGAFFILPALVIWAGVVTRSKVRFGWSLAGLGCAAIVLGFLLNSVVFRFTGASSQGVPFSNFSYTLYGLSMGGERWNAVFDRYPELQNIPEPEHSQRIYDLAFNEIRREPENLVKGMIKQWGLLFSTTRYGAYSFVIGEYSNSVKTVVNLALFVLCLPGLYFCFRKRKEAHASLILYMAAGILASVPFASPQDAYGMRAYAATIPFFALLPALGAVYLGQFIIREQKENRGVIRKFSIWFFDLGTLENRNEIEQNSVILDEKIIIGVGFIFILIVAPIITRAGSTSSPFRRVICQPDQESMYTRYTSGSYVNIVREDVFLLDWLPNFHQSRYERSIHGLPGELQMQGFLEIEAPATIINGLDLVTNQSIWLIVNTDMLPIDYGILGVCGKWNQDPILKEYGFFYADTVELVGK